MSDDQWDKVGTLFEEVQQLPPEERGAYLEEHCQDEAVREEVLALLDVEADASGFFEGLATAVPSGLGEEPPEDEALRTSDPLSLEGKTVGRYDVQEHLGGGGMGIVYRARDPELDRPVALKFLPPHLTAHPHAEERFVREAKAASALDHQHIATIYEIGKTGEEGPLAGQRYIAMAYYDGETLKEKLHREGRLSIDDAVRYGTQVAEALARAHEVGIVHRDVKPANVMVTESGEVKLLDFGLAKAAAQTRLTEPGQRMGTAAYMSPEQAQGKEVDARTDLWALGALLYEMLAGTRPFEGTRKAAIIHSILDEEPASLRSHRPEVPAPLEELIHRCLEKDREDRPASAEVLLEDLRAARVKDKTSSPGEMATENSGIFSGWPRWGAAVTSLLVLGTLLTWAVWPVGKSDEEASTTEPGATPSVAVLPFEVSGSGAQEWRDGMVTMLSMNLDGVAGLRAIADRTVFAAWKKQASSGTGTSAEEALQVARNVGAKYAIVGSAVQLGQDLQLGANVRQTASGDILGKVQVEGPRGSITSMTDRLTRKVLGVLLEKSEERIPSVDLASITTSSLEALKAYLRGERHFRAGEYKESIKEFRAAVRRDSSFAMAYFRLGRALGWTSGMSGAGRAITRAYKHSDQLPERMGRIVEAVYLRASRNHDLAVADSFRALTDRYPDDPTVWYELGETILHGWIPGGWPEAEKAFQNAVQLDPGVAQYYYHLVQIAFVAHRDSSLVGERIEAQPDGPYKRAFQLARDVAFGSAKKREKALVRLGTPGVPSTTVAYMLFHPRDRTLQEMVLRRLLERKDVSNGPVATMLVESDLHRGQVRTAISHLEKYELAPLPHIPSPRCLFAGESGIGTPIPDSVLRPRLHPSRLEEAATVDDLLCAGIYLIESNRVEQLPALIDRLRTTGSEQGLSGGEVRRRIQELEGYRALEAGHRQQAERLLSGHNETWHWGGIWRGDLYRRLGRLDKAEGWYQVGSHHPLAQERMGSLYEKMGKPEKARTAYRRFIEAWKDADPELQGRVEQARQRLDAIGEKTAAE